MSSFKDSFACSDKAFTGLRGIQQMRRSRSTGALFKVRGKVGQTKDCSSKHTPATEMLCGKVLDCALSTIGCDLRMLAPLGQSKLDASIQPLPKTKVVGINSQQKKQQATASSLIKLQERAVQQASSPLANECEKRPCGQAKSCTTQAASALAADFSAGAWSFFSNDIHSYEELHCMMGQDEVTKVSQNKGYTCRRFYCNDIQFYEEFYLLIGADASKFDDELICSAARSSTRNDCRLFYCRDILSYEELFNLIGDDSAAFDDVYFEELAAAADTPNASCRYFYCNAVGSYEELLNLSWGATDQALDNDCLVASASTSSCRSYYGCDIHSYDQLHFLVGCIGCEDVLMDDEIELHCRHSLDSTRSKACSFYGTPIHSYEEFYHIVANALDNFDDAINM